MDDVDEAQAKKLFKLFFTHMTALFSIPSPMRTSDQRLPEQDV